MVSQENSSIPVSGIKFSLISLENRINARYSQAFIYISKVNNYRFDLSASFQGLERMRETNGLTFD
jgi:hypothetical protein